MPRCVKCIESNDVLAEMERLTYQTLDTLMEAHEEIREVEGKAEGSLFIDSAWANIDVVADDLINLCHEMGWFSMPNDRRNATSE